MSETMIKKIVVQLDLNDDWDKRKAMKAASTTSGIDSMSMDMEKKNLTVVGAVNPVDVVKKLRKHSRWNAKLVLVETANEPQKKKEDAPKQTEPKKPETENKDPNKSEADKMPKQQVSEAENKDLKKPETDKEPRKKAENTDKEMPETDKEQPKKKAEKTDKEKPKMTDNEKNPKMPETDKKKPEMPEEETEKKKNPKKLEPPE